MCQVFLKLQLLYVSLGCECQKRAVGSRKRFLILPSILILLIQGGAIYKDKPKLFLMELRLKLWVSVSNMLISLYWFSVETTHSFFEKEHSTWLINQGTFSFANQQKEIGKQLCVNLLLDTCTDLDFAPSIYGPSTPPCHLVTYFRNTVRYQEWKFP